eukprot:4428698-Alexandrium_andersonii.AAC.1
MFGQCGSPAASAGTVWCPTYFAGSTMNSGIRASATCSEVLANLRLANRFHARVCFQRTPSKPWSSTCKFVE